MNNQQLIKLHAGLMYAYVFRQFQDQPVTGRVAYDISQAAFDLHRDLTTFVNQLGEPDLSTWDEDDSLAEFDATMRAEVALLVAEAREQEDDIDFSAITAELS